MRGYGLISFGGNIGEGRQQEKGTEGFKNLKKVELKSDFSFHSYLNKQLWMD